MAITQAPQQLKQWSRIAEPTIPYKQTFAKVVTAQNMA